MSPINDQKIVDQLNEHPRRITWRLLLEMMMMTDMTPHEILCYLNVPPSRARRLLGSKRLQDKLALMQSLSMVRARHMSICFSDQAILTLLRLTQKGKDEAARGASRDLLAMAGVVFGGRFGPAALGSAGDGRDGLPLSERAAAGPARLVRPSPPTLIASPAEHSQGALSKGDNDATVDKA